jgi:hypothetical protein
LLSGNASISNYTIEQELVLPEGQIATLVYGVVKVVRIDLKGVLTSLAPIRGFRHRN